MPSRDISATANQLAVSQAEPPRVPGPGSQSKEQERHEPASVPNVDRYPDSMQKIASIIEVYTIKARYKNSEREEESISKSAVGILRKPEQNSKLPNRQS